MKGTYRLKANHGTHWFLNPDGKETPIRAGETIECEPWQLGDAIRKFDVVVEAPPTPPPAVGLKAVHRGAGRYDVINEATGKPINSESLSRAEANEMVQDGPTPEIEDDDPTSKD